MDAEVNRRQRSPDVGLLEGFLESWVRWREACEDLRWTDRIS
jgi:hypothetical protein